MRAVDTNLLVRLLEQDDTALAAAANAFQQTGGPLWVSHVVLVETVWVLTSSYRRSRKEILGVLEALVGNADIRLQEEALVSLAIAAYRETRADFSDCLVLETARAHGHLPLATFDKNLLKLPDTTQPKAPSH
ncbi:MAG: type II toxin-antitoxin system VapC family toxin [Holophaga sp.]|nr:type II toxin-antitoxin system VapC family toxin [Holophaga sp.]